MSAGAWESVRGSVLPTDDGWTRFSLTIERGGNTVGQVVDVKTARLRTVPHLYRKTLDAMVRDIEVRLG